MVEGRTNIRGNHIFPGDFWCLDRNLYSVRWRSTVHRQADDLVSPQSFVSLDGLFRLARVWRSTGRLAGPCRNVRVLSWSRRFGFVAIQSILEKVNPSRRWFSAFSTSIFGNILNRRPIAAQLRGNSDHEVFSVGIKRLNSDVLQRARFE
jgi:hypothetical protein